MCGAKGSAPTPSGASTTTAGSSSGTSASSFAQGPAPTTAGRYEGFLNQAQALSGTPFNPGMLGQVAPLNPEQTQSLGQMFDLGMHMGDFDPAAVHALESPYTEDVVGATQNWFNNQNAIQGNELIGQGIRSGNAFGGDRMGVAEAALAGQQQLAQAPVIAGLRQTGYTQALDEYNRLKQFGLTGAEEAMKAGTVGQAQSQRELDVAQQNQMMQSAYPFQLANWYGSALGGVGPLTGTVGAATTTTAANTTGISNPPTPNPLTQALGIGSTLFGLGSSIFGKDGGAVGPDGFEPEHFQSGGLVDDNAGGDPLSFILHPGQVTAPPSTLGSVEPQNYRKYYLQMTDLTKGAGGGGRRGGSTFGGGGGGTMFGSRGGVVEPKYLQLGGSSDDDDDGDYEGGNGGGGDTNLITTRGSWYGQNPQAGWRDPGDRPGSNKLGVSEGAQGIATPGNVGLGDYYNWWRPGQIPGRGMPELARKTDVGPAAWTGRGVDISAAAADRAGYTPRNFPTDQRFAYAPVSAMGSPPGLPESQERLPGRAEVTEPTYRDPADPTSTAREATYRPLDEGPDITGGEGGDGGGRGGRGGPRVLTLPGGRPEKTFAQRFATNPFTQAGIAMLQTRSPYFGEGLGAGLAGATHAIERGRAEDVLDSKGKMVTTGDTLMYQVGNQLWDFGIPTKGKGMTDYQKAVIDTRRERERRIAEQGGGTSKTLEKDRETAIGRLTAQIQRGSPGLSGEEARRLAITQLSEQYPQWNLKIPPAPAAPPAAPKKSEGIDYEEDIAQPVKKGLYWGWDAAKGAFGWIKGKVSSETPTAAPAPGATPAPTAAPAPAPTGPVRREAPAPAPKEPAAAPAAPAPAEPKPAAPKTPPDLRQAITSGAATPDVILGEARQKLEKIRDPAKRKIIFDRLKAAGMDYGPLMTPTDAGAIVPRSQ